MSWYTVLGAGVIIGVLLTLFFATVGARTWKNFKTKTPVLRSYWIFSILFALITTATYLVIFDIYDGDNERTAVSLLNHASALTFAIFVGYFAFSQVVESRKDKFDKEAAKEMRAKNYERAISYWKQAHSINRKDRDTLANLLEGYLITKEYTDLNEKLPYLEKLSIGGEKLIVHYLRTTRELFQGHLSEANKEIQLTVDLSKSEPSFRKHLSWGFKELRECPPYQNLRGEAKKLLKNYIDYLDGDLTPEDTSIFEGGNFLIETAKPEK